MINENLKKAIDEISKGEAQDVYRTLGTRFGFSETPRHSHDGKDSAQISEKNLLERQRVVNHVVADSDAIDVDDYGPFWIAPFSCIVMSAMEVHKVKGSDGSAVTLQIEKLADTEASGAGIDLLVTPFDLKGDANEFQESLIVSTYTNSTRDQTMIRGDRLGLVLTGTPTSLRTVIVSLIIQY